MTSTENATNSPRVYHGGSWKSVEPSWVCAASRSMDVPAYRGTVIGFIGFRTSLPHRQPGTHTKGHTP